VNSLPAWTTLHIEAQYLKTNKQTKNLSIFYFFLGFSALISFYNVQILCPHNGMIEELGRELGNLITENKDLDVDKESHPGLTGCHLTEWLVTYRRVFLADQQPPKNHSPHLTIQGHQIPHSHVGRVDDTRSSFWIQKPNFPGLTTSMSADPNTVQGLGTLNAVFLLEPVHPPVWGCTIFFAVPRLELRAYTLATPPALFVLDIFEIGSCKLFAWAGFEPQPS
jgi:hypothetical protein